MEPGGTHAGATNARKEALPELGRIQDCSEVGVRKDKIDLVAERRLVVVRAQLSGKAWCERNGAARPFRLRRAEPAAREVLADADHLGVPIDVHPANGNHFAAAHPSHRRGQDDEAVDSTERSVGSHLEDPLELIKTEEASVGTGLDSRLLNLGDRIGLTPTAPDRVGDSQRWHRDPEDDHIVKMFIYFSDVDEEAGPFEYVRDSAAGGKYGDVFPWGQGHRYPSAAELEEAVDPDDR
jgi:hypothetical protein